MLTKPISYILGRTVIIILFIYLYIFLGGAKWGGGGDGQFQNKTSCPVKTAEKIVQGDHGGKNLASSFYYPGPLFILKKIIVQASANQSCTTCRWEKNSCHRKLPIPPSPSSSSSSKK